MNELFDRLFGKGMHNIATEGLFLHGKAMIGDQDATVIGTCEHAAIDIALALRISGAILDAVRTDLGNAPRPILFIVDTQGQALTRHDELLGLNGYFAHVARSVDLARRCGHRLITLINGEAVSGGFLAFGMLADRICALPGSEVRVMDLRAMSRVTRIDLATLELLAKESPVFAPGAENFWRMGGIHEIWTETDNWADRLSKALASSADDRAEIGLERGGRTRAAPIARCVIGA
jgi:malonate decarboxylase gamma subunit